MCFKHSRLLRQRIYNVEQTNHKLQMNGNKNVHLKLYFLERSRLVVRFLSSRPEARVGLRALPEKKVVGLERGPLSLVITTEELLERKSSGSGLEKLRLLP
jgi:hypothetical protein